VRSIGGAETKRHVLVDGNNLLQRAYYVHIEARIKDGRPLLSGPKGYPTGIIYGFLSFLSSWLYEMQPVSSVQVFFDGAPSRRRVLDPTYKMNRDESKHNLRLGSADTVKVPLTLRDGYEAESDIAVLSHLLQLLGCDIYHNNGEEADDLIATFCKQKEGSVRIVVSDDKDFFQLLTDPRVVLFRPGSREHRFVDAEASAEVWGRLLKGKHPKVPCGQVRMFKTLCGDSSDGIVGVPLLRKRTAMTVCHLPTPDDVFASGMPAFSNSERNKTLEAQDRVRLNWQLVGLVDDLDLSQSLHAASPNYQLAVDICREDLLMIGIDLGPFRPAQTKSVEGPPLDSWLADI
jgi:DNA polymerase-1